MIYLAAFFVAGCFMWEASECSDRAEMRHREWHFINATHEAWAKYDASVKRSNDGRLLW